MFCMFIDSFAYIRKVSIDVPAELEKGVQQGSNARRVLAKCIMIVKNISAVTDQILMKL